LYQNNLHQQTLFIMKKLLNLFLLLGLMSLASAQDVFVDAYDNELFGQSLINTPAGNLLVVGEKVNPLRRGSALNFSDFGMMQVDTSGKPLMSRIYHFQAKDKLTYATRAPRGYVLGGDSRPMGRPAQGAAVVIARTDLRGQVRWSKAFYPNSGLDITLTGLTCNRQGETLFAVLAEMQASTTPSNSRPLEGVVVKLDSLGNTLWTHRVVLGSRFGLGLAPRSTVTYTARGGVIAGWQFSLPQVGTGFALDHLGPNGTLRDRRAYRAHRLLSMAYTLQDSGLAVYAMDTLRRSGLIKFNNQKQIAYAFRDNLPNPGPGSNRLQASLKNGPRNSLPYLFGQQLTLSGPLRPMSSTAPTPLFPAIGNRPQASFQDFITRGREVYLIGRVYSPRHRKHFPTLFKSAFQGNVDNCFTQFTHTRIRPRFGTQPFRVNLSPANPPNQDILDSAIVLRDRLEQVRDSVVCLGEGEVWPGDANSDGFAEARDLLSIGFAWGNRGPARPNASPRWTGQPAPNWRRFFANGANQKHADCDGNGRVGTPDILVLLRNYGRRHSKTATNGKAGDLPLEAGLPESRLQSGKAIEIPVFLGSTNEQARLHGLSFALHYDSEWVGEDLTFIPADQSWLGDAQTNLIWLAKNFPEDGLIEIGISRTDGQDAVGHGKIGVLRFTPKQTMPQEVSLYFSIDETLGMNAAQEEVAIFGKEEVLNLRVEPAPQQFIEPGASRQEAEISLYPNPAQESLQVNTPEQDIEKVQVLNLSGQVMLEKKGSAQSLSLRLESLPPGLYLVKVYTSEGMQLKRVYKE
jgi:hypothetical protein